MLPSLVLAGNARVANDHAGHVGTIKISKKDVWLVHEGPNKKNGVMFRSENNGNEYLVRIKRGAVTVSPVVSDNIDVLDMDQVHSMEYMWTLATSATASKDKYAQQVRDTKNRAKELWFEMHKVEPSVRTVMREMQMGEDYMRIDDNMLG